MENFLSSNEVFTIDLSALKTPADAVFELSQYLDDSKAFGKKIYIKLANIDLSQDQLLSLKSLISSINSTLTYIESPSQMTIASAQAIGIETPNKPPIEQIQIEAQKDEVKEETLSDETQPDPPALTEAEIEAKRYINMGMLNGEPLELPEEEDKNDTEQEPDTVQTSLFNGVSEFSNEQELEDFGSHEEDFSSSEPEIQEEENEDQQKLDIPDFPTQEETQQSVLENIEQSVGFDELAQNTNIQNSEDMQNALTGIFASEQKLESILDEKSERTTIDLAEPLDNTYTEEDEQIDNMCVKYVKQTVRSGNVISSEGNLVIIGDCHPGSEIHAAGDITVWGMLGGIAHAGNKGNKKAKVRALKLNPIQLRIANLYTRRPDSLHSIYAEKTSTFTPEEARILRDEIIIYTLNEK